MKDLVCEAKNQKKKNTTNIWLWAYYLTTLYFRFTIFKMMLISFLVMINYVYECKMPTMVHINNARSININYFHKEEWQGT